MTKIKVPKKLIEVALPLDDINAEASREKSIRHGHPSTLHLWWARRPLAAARAILFAQLVNDPGSRRGISKKEAKEERERLFNLIRMLVKWENINNEDVLREAREEIMKSWRETCELNKGVPGFDPDQLPAFHDPFAGGGAIPLEAQRLGLESYASDLNPVAVMINKAMIEIPPKFAGMPPVNPEAGSKLTKDSWKGAAGLAEDIRYYGQWMREEAYKRIGHLYPEVELPEEHGGGKGKVIAWLWARTVKSPNPAYSHVDVPLIASYFLSSKKGKEVYLEPIIDGDSYQFRIKNGVPKDSERVKKGTKLARGSNFECIMSGTPITPKYIKDEGKAGRLGHRLLAIVVEGKKERFYLTSNKIHESIAEDCSPTWIPSLNIPTNPRWFSPPDYGMKTYGDIFTKRQLVTLGAYSDLIEVVREKVCQDAVSAEMDEENCGLAEGGDGAKAYADAVSIYLALGISRLSDMCNALCHWENTKTQVRHLFGRQAIPMIWDFAEPNVFANAAGDFGVSLVNLTKALEKLNPNNAGVALQADAQIQAISEGKVISTDPPYYDNIGYADLSDFFYLWLRRSLRPIFPSLFTTIAVPKAEELVATPYRHGSKDKAEAFFMEGMKQTMRNLAKNAHPAFPVTIYYAFKQSETNAGGTSSTGWVTFLEAVLQAGFSIVGTWAMRTELRNRLVGKDTNALASSIVLVTKKRSQDAEVTSRRSFIRELNETIPESLDTMIGGNRDASPIAPVDLQQAAIGPGMAVFSKYSAVLEADGSPMPVKTALQLINRVVDAYLNEGGSDIDSDTAFCINWFDQYGWNQAEYGVAEVLATAKGTTVEGLRESDVLEANLGRVRLYKWQDYPADWSPFRDDRTPVWEALHQLVRALQQGGEQAAGNLLAEIKTSHETLRTLCYRLYTICERKGWAEDARVYNELITSWDSIETIAEERGYQESQIGLFD